MPVSLQITLPPQGLRITPGERLEFTATIRNTGNTVTEFRIALTGLDPSWYTITTTTTAIFPGDFQHIPITLHPPRVSTARAGTYEAKIEVISTRDPATRADATIVLELLPFRDYDIEMSPQVASSRGTCKYRITITNKGGVDLSFTFLGKDRENAFSYSFTPQEVKVPVGGKAEVQVSVRPRKSNLTGPPIRRDFSILITPEGDEKERSIDGHQETKALVPGPVLAAIGAVVIVLVGVVVAFASGILPPDESSSPPSTPTPVSSGSSATPILIVTATAARATPTPTPKVTPVARATPTPTPKTTPTPPKATPTPTPAPKITPVIKLTPILRDGIIIRSTPTPTPSLRISPIR